MPGNKPTHILVHHSAVSRTANREQFDAVNRYHADKGWGGIGYHYFIEPSGLLKAGRDETVVGAHCKEAEMNFKSLGICLAGDFDMEDPTPEQLTTLRRIVAGLRSKYAIPAGNVVGHRKFATYKSCPGTRFTDALLADVGGNVPPPAPVFAPPEWSMPAVAWCAEQNIITKITGETVPDYRLATILHNFAKALDKAS